MNVCMNMYVMFLLRQRRLNKLIIIIIIIHVSGTLSVLRKYLKTYPVITHFN